MCRGRFIPGNSATVLLLTSPTFFQLAKTQVEGLELHLPYSRRAKVTENREDKFPLRLKNIRQDFTIEQDSYVASDWMRKTQVQISTSSRKNLVKS